MQSLNAYVTSNCSDVKLFDRDDIRKTPLPVIDAVRHTNRRTDLSEIERRLLIEIILSAGPNGASWAGVKFFAGVLNVCPRTIQRAKRKLKERGDLAEVPSPKRTPYLIPYSSWGDTECQGRGHTADVTQKEHVQDKKIYNVENVRFENAEEAKPQPESHDRIVPAPQPPPVKKSPARKTEPRRTDPKPKPRLTDEQRQWVDHLCEQLDDEHSRGRHVLDVRENPLERIGKALNATIHADAKGLINGSKGAYFTGVLRNMAIHDERNDSEAVCGGPASWEFDEPENQRGDKHENEPIATAPPEPEAPDFEGARRGLISCRLQLAYRSGNVPSLLTAAEPYVHHTTARTLWDRIREILPDSPETERAHQFIEAVVNQDEVPKVYGSGPGRPIDHESRSEHPAPGLRRIGNVLAGLGGVQPHETKRKTPPPPPETERCVARELPRCFQNDPELADLWEALW